MSRAWSVHLPDLWHAQGGLCCWCQSLALMVRDFHYDEGTAWPHARLWTSHWRRVWPGGARENTPDWIELFGPPPVLTYPVARLGARQAVTTRGVCFPVATVDHIVPRKRGHDPIDVSNMAMACKPCNNARDQMKPRDFLRYLGIDPALIPHGTELLHP